MAGELINIDIANQEEILLVDVFEKLNLHPFVGYCMFVSKFPINESAIDIRSIRFLGYDIRIHRMGGIPNIKNWRVTLDVAMLIEKRYHESGLANRENAEFASKHIYDAEQRAKHDADMHASRFLLQIYEHQQLSFKAKISNFYYVPTYKNGSNITRLRVCFQNLINPETGAVYADHTNVLLNDELKNIFLNLAIGTVVEFKATVHSYCRHNETKYGIHKLQDVVAV